MRFLAQCKYGDFLLILLDVVLGSRSQAVNRPAAATLSPIKASPRKPLLVSTKENAAPLPDQKSTAAPIKATRFKVPLHDSNVSDLQPIEFGENSMTIPRRNQDRNKRGRVLRDVTAHSHNVDEPKQKDRQKEEKKSTGYLDRSQDRIREFERLKELERKELLDDSDSESFQDIENERETIPSAHHAVSSRTKLPSLVLDTSEPSCLQRNGSYRDRSSVTNGFASPISASFLSSKSCQAFIHARAYTIVGTNFLPNFSLPRSVSVSDTSAFKNSLRSSLGLLPLKIVSLAN